MNNQSAIKLFLGMILFMAILSVVACSSRSGKKLSANKAEVSRVITTDSIITMRGKNLITGMIAPVTIHKSKMVYRPLDTVWVYVKTGEIQPNMTYKVNKDNDTEVDAFQPYRLYSTN